jgi:hypothetical protein
MMVGVIVLFAKEHEPAASQAVNQGSAVDGRARRHIPDPPHEGMILPERRLPWFSGCSLGRLPREEHAEHECASTPDGPAWMAVP